MIPLQYDTEQFPIKQLSNSHSVQNHIPYVIYTSRIPTQGGVVFNQEKDAFFQLDLLYKHMCMHVMHVYLHVYTYIHTYIYILPVTQYNYQLFSAPSADMHDYTQGLCCDRFGRVALVQLTNTLFDGQQPSKMAPILASSPIQKKSHTFQ